MAGLNTKRIRKELIECGKEQETSGITAEPVGGSLSHLTGTLKGPEGTPYEGGVFVVDIHVPDTYPFEPLKMKFTTRIWHPNVSSVTGAICLDILKDQWSPALTIKTALVSLQALLSTPEPSDPQDAEVAKQYLKDYDTWCKTARFWTESYAVPKKAGGDEAALAALVEMGFAREAAAKALAGCDGDQEAALMTLLG